MKKNLTVLQRARRSVIGAFLVTMGTGMSAALSLFYLPITSELGCTQASLALYVSIMGLCSIVTHPTIGKLIAKLRDRMRWIGIFNAVYSLCIYFCLSRCRQLYQFYICGVFMSVMVPIVGGTYGSAVVSHWFVKKRSVAMAIVLIGISAGTVLYSQVCRYIIDAFGWRAGYMGVGSLVAAFSIAGALFISAPPEHYGLKPYGWEEQNSQQSVQKTGRGFTLKEAQKTPSFWLFMAAGFFASLYVMGLQQSIVPMFQVDFHFTAALATVLMSVFSVACAAAKPVMGIIYEKRGVSFSVILLGGLLVLSLLLLIVFRSIVPGVLGMILLGAGNLFTTVIMSSYTADAFGDREYSAILGFLNIAVAIGCSIAPQITGKSFDLTGSYHAAYSLFIAFAVISTVLTLVSSRMMKKRIECAENLPVQE